MTGSRKSGSTSRYVAAALCGALIVAGCAAPGGGSRAVGTDIRDIAWDARRPLSWSDFRGPVDGAAGHERVAMTAATLRWNYDYALERDASACRYWIQNVESEAVFNPADSWVRPGNLTEAVLRHEQSHFDLTEVFKRELDVRTTSLINTRRNCGGTTLEDAVASAERGAAALVQAVFDDVWSSYVATQERYDDLTGHGTRGDAQLVWSQAIADALASGRWEAPR